MNKRVFSFFLFFSLFATFTATFAVAQTKFTDAKEVLKTTYQQTGGAKWEAIKTVKFISSMHISNDDGVFEGNITEILKIPGFQSLTQTIDTPDGSFTTSQVFTPTKSWFIGEEGGKEDGPMRVMALSASAEMHTLLTPENEFKLEDGTFKNKAVYAVNVKGKTGDSVRYYDKETLLLVGILSKSESGDTEIEFSDYRDEQGLMMWHKRVITSPSGSTNSQVRTKVELNMPIDETVFEDK